MANEETFMISLPEEVKELDTELLHDDYNQMTFRGENLQQILNTNQKGFTNAYIELSMKGIAKVYVEDRNVTAEYWLVKMQD